MYIVLILCLVFAMCHGQYARPHSEYGVSLDYLKKIGYNTILSLSGDYGVPKQVLQFAVPAPRHAYGVPQVKDDIAPVMIQYYNVIPDTESVVTPAFEYGVPRIHEKYGTPHLRNKPHDEYRVPQAKKIVPDFSHYNYFIPRVKPIVTPAAKYGIPKILEEYGVPQFRAPKVPHSVYGLPTH